jgi:hypothetical protein
LGHENQVAGVLYQRKQLLTPLTDFSRLQARSVWFLIESIKNYKTDRFQNARATLWVQLNPCRSRHASRRGLSDHKWSITMSGGREKPAFGGPNPSIWCVAPLARCTGIALRTAPARVAGFDSIKGFSNCFLWY